MSGNGSEFNQNPYEGSDNNYEYYGGYSHFGQKNKTFRDVLLVLREKIWYFIVAFLVIVSVSIVYCFKATPIYTGTAMLQILRDDTQILDTKSIESSDIRSNKDLITQVKIIESLKLINSVADRLTPEQHEQLMAPYKDDESAISDLTSSRILFENRRIIPVRTSLMIAIEYNHPDPEIASLVANLFANEYINYKVRLDIENSMKAVDDLKARADQQRMRVEDIESKMALYRELHESVSLERQADIDHQELAEINTAVTRARGDFDVAQGRIDLITQFKQKGRPLWNLAFISEMDHVKSLLKELSTQKISVSTYEKRYGAKHPRMIEARRSVKETVHELNAAVDIAVEKTQNSYEHLKANLNSTLARLHKKENAIIALGKTRVEYSSLARDHEVNVGLYRSLVLRMNTELAQIDLVKPNARVIDKAFTPSSPSKPNKFVIIAAGILSGFISGIMLVFLAAQVDDRARSAYDIESVLGLTLIGAVPRIKKNSSRDKAYAVAVPKDRYVTEAFRSIHSTLRINNSSKDAKIVLCTSTQPSEGKTFFTLNLAATYAAHNEKCIVIDTDLRVPTIAKLLGNDNRAGLIQYAESSASLDSIIQHDPVANIDFIPSGGISQHPTRLLTSGKLQELLVCLKQRYDHILIDSPPLGAVSDMLNVLPYVDGLLYVIKFNATSRKAIKRNILRISDASTPVIGAVINQVSTTMADYYYSSDYNSKYMKNYIRDIDRRDDDRSPPEALSA